MAFCQTCGQKIQAGAKFCPGCGEPNRLEENDASQRKQVFQGDIHKCPNCGEPLKAFQSVCPSCGYEFRNTESSNAVKEFSRKLDQIEAGRKPETKLGSVAKAFGMGRADTTDEQILNHIRNFNVPNTKEDVFEFMILASSSINTSVLSANNSSDAGANSVEELNTLKARNDAWIAKVEQVYEKAKLSFESDPDFGKIQNLYERTTQSIQKAKKQKVKKVIMHWLPMAAIFALCILYFAGMGISHSSKERKLEQTVQEIQVDISNGDYDAALIRAQSLHMDDNWSSESKEHWDEQRESLIKLIEQKKEESK